MQDWPVKILKYSSTTPKMHDHLLKAGLATILFSFLLKHLPDLQVCAILLGMGASIASIVASYFKIKNKGGG
jgi:hypothetical protein